MIRIKEQNVPNKITIARIFLIFIFLALSNIGQHSLIEVNQFWTHVSHITAYTLAIIAGITDFLDGYLARKYNVVTDFGKLMDPLADKVFVTATFIMMVEKGLMPAWIAVVVISREFLVTGLRLLATNRGEVISADKWGKLKTFLQMLMLLIGGAAWVSGYITETRESIYWHIILWSIVSITVYSGVSYFVKNKHLYAHET